MLLVIDMIDVSAAKILNLMQAGLEAYKRLQRLCNSFAFFIRVKTKTLVMKKLILAIAPFLVLTTAVAQNNQPRCAAAENKQFDFWVGEWALYSADTLTGSNSVYRIMDGCTVQENFSNPKTGYIGKSWTVYNPLSKQWQQTWVDNQGGYIPLTGTFENAKMTLTTPARRLPNGKETSSRMIYYNISNDSFDWDWQATTDGGVTWNSNWKIHYVRKK
jgi:hypothetical protein